MPCAVYLCLRSGELWALLVKGQDELEELGL